MRRRGRLIAETNLEKADEAKKKKDAKADALERAFLEKAPTITLSWGDMVCRLRLIGGRDGLRRQTLAEAVRRAHQAIDRITTLALGQVRGGDSTIEDAISWGASILISELPEQMRGANRVCPGSVTIGVETNGATK